MKLRNKLALVLATAMVATSVPVVTMADADVTVKKTAVVKKDNFSTGASLKIDFKDHDSSDGDTESFYLTFENAEWNEDLVTDVLAAGLSDWKVSTNGVYSDLGSKTYTYTDDNYEVVVTKQKDKEWRVDVTSVSGDFDEKVVVPIAAKLTGGSATVTVTGTDDSTLGFTEKTYTFSSTGDDDAQVIVGDVSSFYKKGELNELTFKDTYTGSIDADDFTIRLELQDPDYDFYDVDEIKLEGTLGYGKLGEKKLSEISGVTVKVDPDNKKDYGLLEIVIPAGTLSGINGGAIDSLGRLTLKNVWVKTTESDPTEGDFKVKVSGEDDTDLVDDGTLVLGKVVAYSHYIEMDDEKVVEIKAGRQEDVTFKVGEYIDDCFVGGRDLEITLDNEDTFFIVEDIAKACAANDDDGYVFKPGDSEFDDFITDSEKDMDLTVEGVSFKWDDDYAPSDVYAANGNVLANAENDYCRATAIIVTMSQKTNSDNENINTNGEEDWFKVETAVYVPVDQLKKVDENKATIKLKASGMAMAEDAEQDAILIKKPFDVTFDSSVLKVGLQSQVAQDITLTETDKEMLEKGDLYLNVAADKKGGKGIEIEDKGELNITAGDLKKTDFDKDGQNLELEVKRQSGSAATIVFDDPQITVDRSVPEGNYALELSGSAIDKYDGSVKYDNYITIGTANTQDLTASNGLVKGTASFKIGETKYTAIDGTEVTMDAASYIQDPGYTMVPVKYVALAFGITEDCISYSNGKIAIVTGSKAIGLERNSNIATVNGVQVPMSTKVVLKDGRTYAPIADVAKILGITPAWDSATKTAAFTNK